MDGSDSVERWEALVDADDQRATVMAHLSQFASTPECHEMLARLMERFERVELDDERLVLVFTYAEYPDTECLVTCDVPYDGPAGDVPASTLAVARVHNGFVWEYEGGGWIGFNGVSDGVVQGGGWEWQALTEAAEANAVFLERLAAAGLKPLDVDSPSDYGQNWLIWDPTERNALGEPVLLFVSHEDCEAVPVVEARDLPFGAVLLRLMVQDILGEDVFGAVYS
jgi:hypothetical protein